MRSPGRLSGAGCHTHLRESSCWRSSSPAPRSASRQRRPESAPASASAQIGASTNTAAHARSATLSPNADPISAAAR